MIQSNIGVGTGAVMAKRQHFLCPLPASFEATGSLRQLGPVLAQVSWTGNWELILDSMLMCNGHDYIGRALCLPIYISSIAIYKPQGKWPGTSMLCRCPNLLSHR